MHDGCQSTPGHTPPRRVSTSLRKAHRGPSRLAQGPSRRLRRGSRYDAAGQSGLAGALACGVCRGAVLSVPRRSYSLSPREEPYAVRIAPPGLGEPLCLGTAARCAEPGRSGGACPGTYRSLCTPWWSFATLHGEPCLSRGVLGGRMRLSGLVPPVYDAVPLPSASHPAPTPRDGAESRTTRRVLRPVGRRRARDQNHLTGLATAARVHLCHQYVSDRQCCREKCRMLRAGPQAPPMAEARHKRSNCLGCQGGLSIF